jgi:hypothetical protein
VSRDRTYDFLYAAEATRVLHAPTRALETFGTTSVNYHLLAELEDHPGKIRIREGRLQANKPEIMTPERYVKDEFEGFGEMAKLYYDFLKQHEDEMKILKYGYRLKQEAFSEQIVTDSMESVAERVVRGVLLRGDRLRLREGIRRGKRGEACRKQRQKQEQCSCDDLKSELNSFHGVTPLSVHIICFVTVL